MNWKKSSLLLFSGLIMAAAVTLSGKSVTSHYKGTRHELRDRNTIINKNDNAAVLFSEAAMTTYRHSNLLASGLDSGVFKKAYTGFINLKAAGKIAGNAAVLSIADFSFSSKKKRLWIVDLKSKRLLLNTWVAHGQGSGNDLATKFSNRNNSHQSSLGFYVTGEVYYGKHGRSIRLDGMDKGFNNKARERAIVIHGASYVSEQAILGLNRLGRSHGCPAVPAELADRVIDLIKGKSVLFVHADVDNYASAYLNEKTAVSSFLANNPSNENGMPDDGNIGAM